MMNLTPNRTPEGRPLVVISVASEAADAIGVMRNLKKAFPQEFRAIALEIDAPEQQQGIVLPSGDRAIGNGRINGANRLDTT